MLLLAAKKVMNQKALSSLEYPKIIERLTEKASSPMGKELCRKLQPSTDINKIRLMQTQTKDALTRLFQKGSVSFGSVKDIRGSLKRLEIGNSFCLRASGKHLQSKSLFPRRPERPSL